MKIIFQCGHDGEWDEVFPKYCPVCLNVGQLIPIHKAIDEKPVKVIEHPDLIDKAHAWLRVNAPMNSPIPSPLYELVSNLALELLEARQKLTELGQ